MNCPLCSAQGAQADENTLDWTVLHCPQCGNINFTNKAYAELSRLGANEKTLVIDYCRNRVNPSEVITEVRLKNITQPQN